MRYSDNYAKNRRYEKNLKWLEESDIEWKWVDTVCDHVLLEGKIDYYLGKTYWFNRRTKEKGYDMLKALSDYLERVWF